MVPARCIYLTAHRASLSHLAWGTSQEHTHDKWLCFSQVGLSLRAIFAEPMRPAHSLYFNPASSYSILIGPK
ncbi:hypothetical protein M413DRAFT_441408 [Hebeloma cylindrosporum]|uniref:Uncharacterized protein n=1 Tax=Hebeloma cylindrosporum TaxID=76867 RepID=A0A0C2Y907_HEBCY|nr:hypothetical protein M413DRAFT_441408 [Hebeloma cylindrosporum h7]